MAKLMEKLAQECAQYAQALGEELGAMDVQVSESKKAMIFLLELRLSCVEIVLTTKNSVMCPIGTLFARVYPQKNRPLFLHLYELMDEDDFRCCYFPYNHSSEQLHLSFTALADLLRELLPRAEAMALDDALYEPCFAEKCAAIAAYAKEDVAPLREYLTEEEIQTWLFAQWGEYYEMFAQLMPFTRSDAYTAFVAGDMDKALKKYRPQAEKGKLEPYFVRLYSFLHTAEAHTFQPIPPECAELMQAATYGNSNEEGKLLLVTAAFCYLAVLVAEWLIAGVTYLILGQGASFYPLDWLMVFLLPLGSAAFGCVALRRKFIPLVFRDKAEKVANIDRMANSKGWDVVATTLTALMTAAVLFFGFLFVAANPRFYTDRMVWDAADKFPLLNPVTYAYEDIEQVYYIEGRINVFDELVERGSYVLVFADGTAIDMDASISVKETEEHVLPLLDPYINEIITYPTDVELAKQYDKSVDDFFGYNDVAW